MSTLKIDKHIVKYRVRKPDDKPAESKVPDPDTFKGKDGKSAKVIRMHEEIQRPEMLIGSTYKIKTPVSDHAMYVTINDIILNEGTPHEQRRPFEVFINTKNLDHFQWIVALTRVISAVFRKGGDVTFLVDELKAVFDPRGGYWQPGGKFMGRVDGTPGSHPPGGLRGSWIDLCEFAPELFPVFVEMNRGRIKSSPDLTANLLWQRKRLDTHSKKSEVTP